MIDFKIYLIIALSVYISEVLSIDFKYEYFKDSLKSDKLEKEPFFLKTDVYSESSDLIGVKKIPKEDKHLKKTILPPYPIIDKDSAKYKDIVLKSGLPYCQEIKIHSNNDKINKDTCYKCKDLKTGNTYDYCTYNPKKDDNYSEYLTTRKRRSNSNIENIEKSPSTKMSLDDSKLKVAASEHIENLKDRSNFDRKFENPYRFSDEIFTEASEYIPDKYKKNHENCEKVLKDSMICMVCKDMKSKAKYEQCSYVAKPNEKSYAYSKSKSFGKEHDEDAEPDEKLKCFNLKVDPEKKYYESSYPSERYERSQVKVRNDEETDKDEEKSSTTDCKKFEKDGKICTVCKDPKTGGNYEKCSYAYQPKDKVYKFSRSKSFGYPENSSKISSSSNKEDEDEKSDRPIESKYSDYSKDYNLPDESKSYYDKSDTNDKKDSYDVLPDYYQSPSEYKSESEINSEKIDQSNCKIVEKDSMTCKICKDPKSGDNFEQCSYAYKPKDKVYAYTKGNSYGSPTKSDDNGDESKGYDVQENIRKIIKTPYYNKPYDKDYNKGYDKNEDSNEKEAYPSENSERLIFEPSTLKEAAAATKAAIDETKKKVNEDTYFDNKKKKADIEKVLKEFQNEDRKNCKKVMKDQMTCYQCTDENDFRKEECMFIGDQEQPDNINNNSNDKFTYREVKQYKIDPDNKSSSSSLNKSQLKRKTEILEPIPSASEDSYVTKLKPVESVEKTTEEEKLEEVEPYESVAETRPIYDKNLGLTLPAFMLTKSEHEQEFDDMVESSRI
ncbi:PREDICTED: protein starmaker [Polistes dominula]|uniref:Protein starmaker n=1 Tax=Polistes dominula TaxID=743375 RepID=A0ABM1I2U8_POLDO|nr:PREDICTED: protein starmaker [Polistes dominula]